METKKENEEFYLLVKELSQHKVEKKSDYGKKTALLKSKSAFIKNCLVEEKETFDIQRQIYLLVTLFEKEGIKFSITDAYYRIFLKRYFPDEYEVWRNKRRQFITNYGTKSLSSIKIKNTDSDEIKIIKG